MAGCVYKWERSADGHLGMVLALLPRCTYELFYHQNFRHDCIEMLLARKFSQSLESRCAQCKNGSVWYLGRCMTIPSSSTDDAFEITKYQDVTVALLTRVYETSWEINYLIDKRIFEYRTVLGKTTE